jgi:hypothetical protein
MEANASEKCFKEGMKSELKAKRIAKVFHKGDEGPFEAEANRKSPS